MWYRVFKATIFRPLVRFGFRARIIGAQKVPSGGGAILASNHIATMDSLVVPAMLPRKLTFPAKAELFSGKSPQARIIAWFLRAVGQVPMDRGGGRASAASLQVITDVLADGNVIGIYPEGTRSPDGRLYKGKTGIARMVLNNSVPVIPVGVVGTHTTRGPFGIPWVKRPLVLVGEPLDFSHLSGRASETKVQRWVTDEVMRAIQELTGQIYVDVYANRVKYGDLKDKGADEFIVDRPGGNPVPEPREPASGN